MRLPAMFTPSIYPLDSEKTHNSLRKPICSSHAANILDASETCSNGLRRVSRLPAVIFTCRNTAQWETTECPCCAVSSPVAGSDSTSTTPISAPPLPGLMIGGSTAGVLIALSYIEWSAVIPVSRQELSKWPNYVAPRKGACVGHWRS